MRTVLLVIVEAVFGTLLVVQLVAQAPPFGLADLAEEFPLWSAGMVVAMPDLPAVGTAPPKSGGRSLKLMGR